MLYLPLLDELFDRSGYVLDRHVQIDAVLIKQLNHVYPQTPERSLSYLLDVFRPAVQCAPPAAVGGVCFPPEFGGDHDVAAKRSECFSDEFLIRKRSVHFRRIEERDAALYGGT